MGPQAIPDIDVFFFCIKDVFKITEIIEPTGCFNQNHVSLAFDDYKLSLQWKRGKKTLSARKEDCTTLWPNRLITYQHLCPLPWDLENSSLAGHNLFTLPIILFVQCNHYLQIFKGLLPPCQDKQYSRKWSFQLGKNKRVFRKGGPSFVPWCHQSVVPPNSSVLISQVP